MNDLETHQFDQESPDQSRQDLIHRFHSCRKQTVAICEQLQIEDYTIQPCSWVSPPKWHLGHTTWFFEDMILTQYSHDYCQFNHYFRSIFNSYYHAAGKPWAQENRGHLSRPTVSEVIEYRKFVDCKIEELLKTASNKEVHDLVEVGLQHEQQHQELLMMDIKYIMSVNPLPTCYFPSQLDDQRNLSPSGDDISQKWSHFVESIYEIGNDGSSFAFDNESPKHKSYVYSFGMCQSLVTNGRFLEFVGEGGYREPKFWTSQGWNWVLDNKIQCPLYWFQQNNEWIQYSLNGIFPLHLNDPVVHVSYFEADAFARWSGHRLPTEQESEIFLRDYPEDTSPQYFEVLQPCRSDSVVGQVWWWTSSHYSPYPRFQPFRGMLAEYNGKFMCNQFVLKGGSVATPKGHYRHTYRNFFQPNQRWMFSGIRLAKDLK